MSLYGERRFCLEAQDLIQGNRVDKAKIEIIERMAPPSNVKGIQSFFAHAGFYQVSIKDFSKITKHLCDLLSVDVPFDLNDDCLIVFNRINELILALVIASPNWTLPFEFICDACDYVF